MSGRLNKVYLIGRLGKDPEVKVTPSGESVAKFSLATDESWKDKSGQKQARTTWHNIDCWSKQAEFASAYLKKGAQVLVEGKIQNSEYTDKDGAKRIWNSIRCTNLQSLDKRQGEHDGEEHTASQPSATGGYEDDLPDFGV